VARSFWRAAIPCGAGERWFVDGLAQYTATVSLAAQYYDGSRNQLAIGALEQRYAGGFLPWVLRATVPAWTAGNGASVYRVHLNVESGSPRV